MAFDPDAFLAATPQAATPKAASPEAFDPDALRRQAQNSQNKVFSVNTSSQH